MSGCPVRRLLEVVVRADDTDGIRKDLAAALLAAREATNMSGRELARRTHMSQSKVSRLERNQLVPTSVDVELILHVLKPPFDVVERITSLTRRANIEYSPDRKLRKMGWDNKQREMQTLEQGSHKMRLFLPAMLPGLIHTPAYALASISSEVAMARAPVDVVPLMLQRQQVLRDGPGSFHFVFTEQSLRWPLVEPAAHAAQMRYLVEISHLPRVDLRAIPFTGHTIRQGPMNTFVVYDRRLVSIEVSGGEIALRDPRDIAYHLELFAFFQSIAETPDDTRTLITELAEEYE